MQTAQLQAEDTRAIETYNFVVEGKLRPSPQDLAQLARILADAGIEMSEGRDAPPEFWRSIVATAKGHNTDARIVWDVKVSPRFGSVYKAIDLGMLTEGDRTLLLDLEDARREGRMKITIPEGCEVLAHTLVDALADKVPECEIAIEGTEIKLTPLPVVGQVKIVKTKLDAIPIDLSAENPRLHRIQEATKLAKLDELLAAARRGVINQKADQDSDRGDTIGMRCPHVCHSDGKPSAWVRAYPDGVGWGCKGCQKQPSSYPGLIRAYHRRLTWDAACTDAEIILGLTPWGVVPEADRVVGDEITALAVQAAQQAQEAPQEAKAEPKAEPESKVEPKAEPESKVEPPAAPFAAWLKRQTKIGPAEVAWLQCRKLDPVVLARRVLMWAATASPARWDGITFDETFLDAWGALCARAHTILLPTVDHTGTVVGVRARLTCGDSSIKARTPSLWVGRESRGIPQRGVLPCVQAMRALQGLDPWPALVVVAEGEPDFLTACQLFPQAAVLGMYAAEASWTQEVADRIPDGTKVYILTDPDGRGNAYRRRVIRKLRGRCRVWRLDGRRDLNAQHARGEFDPEESIVEDRAAPLDTHEADNSIRVADHVAGRALHTPDAGWLMLRDDVWVPDKGEKSIKQLAEEALRKIPEEAQLIDDEDVKKEIHVWARKSLSVTSINRVVGHAATRPELSADDEELDKDPYLLGTPSGVLDLRAATLLDDVGPALVTKRVTAEWDPAAQCPTWERFLYEVFAGNANVVEFVRRWLGYCLTGEMTEQKLVVFHGELSNNGKSTMLDVLMDLWGDYAYKANPTVLSADRAKGAHETDRKGMRGRRLTLIDEWPAGIGFDESEVKARTGGKHQSDRGIRENQQNYVGTTKILVATNPLIDVRGDDRAIWRRLLYVLFGVSFEDRPDKDKQELPGKLRAELPGILAWCVRGTQDWIRDGLNPPAEVQRHTAEARDEADDLGRWAEACLEFGPSFSASPTELAESWADWALRVRMVGKKARQITLTSARKAVVARWKLAEARNDGWVIYGVRVRPKHSPFAGAMPPTDEDLDVVVSRVDRPSAQA